MPGHGALNSALMMDVVLGQARELEHDLFILFLDMAQFFPAIKRSPRRAAEYFIGLPSEVAKLAEAVFARSKHTGSVKAGCSARQASRRKLPDKYEWMQEAMRQVKGRKKRCELVWALIAEWDTDSSVEPDEFRADRKAIYRRMGG